MNHTNKNDAVQLSGVLAKSLSTEEWCAGILIMSPCSIAIMEESISDTDFDDPRCQAVFQSVREIISANNGTDPIDFVDRLAKATGKRGVDAIELQNFCDRLTRKIARDVCDTDAEIWSGYLADESRKKREQKRIEDAERSIVEVRARFDRGDADLSEVGAVMREASEAIQADGEGDGGKDGDEFEFLHPSEIDEPIEAEWWWRNFIPKQVIVILSALPKVGKTTLLRAVIANMENGGACCGQRVEPCKVLYVSEEGKRTWKPRLAQFGIGDHVLLSCVPFLGRPTMPDFRRYLREVEKIIKDQNIAIVVFDTASKLLPIGKENDSDDVDPAMAELARLTEAGASVVVVHHDRKSGGDPVSRMRGSLAYGASADVILSLEKMKNAGHDDPRRVLYGDGRFDEVASELVIEFDGSNFIADGSKAEVKRLDVMKIISDICGVSEPGMKADDIWKSWPEDQLIARPRKTKFYDILKRGAESDPPIWKRSGTGLKGSPFCFRAIPIGDGSRTEETGIQFFLPHTLSIGGRKNNRRFSDDNGLVSSADESGRITQTETLETATNNHHNNGFTGRNSSDGDVPI